MKRTILVLLLTSFAFLFVNSNKVCADSESKISLSVFGAYNNNSCEIIDEFSLYSKCLHQTEESNSDPAFGVSLNYHFGEDCPISNTFISLRVGFIKYHASEKYLGDKYPVIIVDNENPQILEYIIQPSTEIDYSLLHFDLMANIPIFSENVFFTFGPSFGLPLTKKVYQDVKIIEPLGEYFTFKELYEGYELIKAEYPDIYELYENYELCHGYTFEEMYEPQRNNDTKTAILLDEDIPDAKSFHFGINVGLTLWFDVTENLSISPYAIYMIGLTDITENSDNKLRSYWIGLGLNYTL